LLKTKNSLLYLSSHIEQNYERSQIYINGLREAASFVWAKVVVMHPTGATVKILFCEAANDFQTRMMIVDST